MSVQKIDYQQYLKDQITRAESKWGRKWEYDEIFKQALRLTIDSVKKEIGEPKDICCMGCRQGTEVFEFKERFPKAKVYGVDITDNIDSIRTHLDVHIEKQDFNKLPDNWENKFDLIFSNSLDHSYEPRRTINEWARVTRSGGHMLLELSTTPENNIEHSFKNVDLDILFAGYWILEKWESPERNIFTVLVKVVK